MYGLALLFGETLVSLATGNLLSNEFYKLATSLYALIGLLIGISAHPIRVIIRYISQWAFKLELKNLRDALIIAVFLIFLQGLVVINELVLAGLGFYSLISIMGDLLWLILCIALLCCLSLLSKRISSFFALRLLIGVVLCSILISTFFTFLKNPLTDDNLHLFLQIVYIALAFLFLFSIPMLLLPSRKIGAMLSTLVSVCLCLIALDSVGSGIIRGFFLSNNRDVEGKPNVILIVVDTLRADHLSCYGYNFNTSPNIDRFCLESAKFDNCFSPANWTAPGHASIFTGRYPISDGVHKVLVVNDQSVSPVHCMPLDSDEITLAEILRTSGYQTAAVISNTAIVSREFGFDQGFEYWFAKPPSFPSLFFIMRKFLDDIHWCILLHPSYRRAEDITNIALRWVKGNSKKPFFLFLNYMDPHQPWLPPYPYDALFPGKIENYLLDTEAVRKSKKKLDRKELKHIQSQYDGEIAYLDKQLGMLFESLKSYRLYDNSIVIITSDHGEFLGEHGLVDHQVGLYNPITMVPLIIKPYKDFSWLANTNQLVQTVDIVPTVLEMLGIEVPREVQGESLLGEITHPIISQHYADAHIQKWFGGQFGSDQISLIGKRYKLISSMGEARALYDFYSDPKENINLVTENLEESQYLLGKLRQWRDSVDTRLSDAKRLPNLDDATVEQLKALGYLR